MSKRSIAALTVALTMTTGLLLAAGTAEAASRPHVSLPRASVMNSSRKPFRIRAGKIYDVTATLSGVRRHDRLALEVHSRRAPHRPKRWRVLGSWPLHRGEHHFRGLARTAVPGLYTLRVQFLRHHRKLRGSQSNRFRVRVTGRHAHRRRKPTSGVSNGISNGFISVSGWTPTCGTPPAGNDITMDSPVSQPFSNDGWVDQVLWIRFAAPGGNFGNWVFANDFEQYITQPGEGPGGADNVIVGSGGEITTNELMDMALGDGRLQDPTFVQLAWNLRSWDGTQWVWGDPNDVFTPGSYRQIDQNGETTTGSSTCELFP